MILQNLGAMLPYYLTSQLPNVLAVIIGCVIGTMYLPHKPNYWARVVVSSALVVLWTLFMDLVDYKHIQNFVALGIINFGGLFFFSALAVGCYCQATKYQALFAVTLSYSLQNICERLIEIPIAFLSDDIRPLIITLLILSLYWYYQYCKKYRKRQTILDFSNVNDQMTVMMASIVVIVSVVLDLLMKTNAGTQNKTMAVCVCVLMILFSAMAIVVCLSHLRETDAQKRADESALLLRSEQRRFEHDKQVHDAINIKCHDIRHQIAAIRSNSTDEAYRAELKKIGKLVDLYDATPHSQNAALDVVLSSKMLACQGRNIVMTCMADGRRLGFMEDCDIYALFGNIMENAIEAVSQVIKPEQRMISLSVATKGDFLTIEVENFFTGQISFEDGLPVTTKEDKDNHGYGTQSIRMLVEKYDGYMKYTTQEDIFTLSILLPISENA